MVGTHRRIWAAAAAAVVLVLAAILFVRWGSSGAPVAAPRATPSASASAPPTVADVYASVAPSVVSIEADRPGERDTGTGVIVNADATILTALHVVKGAATIKITFADGTESAATVSATAPESDIATLAPATLPGIVVPAVLGGSRPLAVGDDVIAIGNPFGLTRTTTTGVVSGLGRGARNPDGVDLSGLIQFDAAVNPGSSGGPLLDGRGGVVGIVVALANPTKDGTFIGIGFAVPIGTAVATGRGGDPGPQQ